MGGRRCMPMEDFISARPFFDLPAPTRSRKETVQVADAQSPIATRVVLTPKAGTPCMPACDDPASPSCQNCCRTVTHETDWSCQTTAGSSSTAASCCTGDWDATCWNVASAANNDHACNQCLPPVIPFNWDFTTKVIKTIKKKGFWETHCQLACYDRENCGAYVYTKGTCKLFRTLPINEATAEQFETGLSDLSEKKMQDSSRGKKFSSLGLMKWSVYSKYSELKTMVPTHTRSESWKCLLGQSSVRPECASQQPRFRP